MRLDEHFVAPESLQAAAVILSRGDAATRSSSCQSVRLVPKLRCRALARAIKGVLPQLFHNPTSENPFKAGDRVRAGEGLEAVASHYSIQPNMVFHLLMEISETVSVADNDANSLSSMSRDLLVND